MTDEELAAATRVVTIGGEGFPVIDIGAGPPVILLHGFPDSRRLWRYQVPALVSAGLRVIAPDLRGFGDAPLSANLDAYRAKNLTADVIALATALNIDTFRVIGHDWGASVAWGLAMAYPARVQRLVVMSVGAPGASGWQTTEQRQRSWYFYFFQFENVAEAWLQHDNWRMLREWARGAVDLERSISDLARPGRLTAGLNWYRANVAPKLPPSSPPAFPKPAMPVLALWGEHDPFLTEAQLTTSRDCVAGSWTYHRIESAGHWIMLDQPARINQLLGPFLSGL